MEKQYTRSPIDWHYNGPPKEEITVYDAVRYEEYNLNQMMKEKAASYKTKADKTQAHQELDDEKTQNNLYLLL